MYYLEELQLQRVKLLSFLEDFLNLKFVVTTLSRREKNLSITWNYYTKNSDMINRK
jgi:hypothetical protein